MLFILLLHTSWCLIFILKLPIKVILLEWWQHEFSLHHYFIYLNIPSIRCYIFQTCLKKPKCQAKLDLIYVEFHESFSPSGLQLVAREVILFKKRAISSLSWFYHLVYLPKEFGHVCRKAETLKELKALVCKVRNVNLKYKGHLNEETMIYQAKVDKFTICFKKWFKISWWHCLRLWFDKLEIQCQCKLQ